MAIDYWLVTRDKNTLVKERDIESSFVEQKELFMFNIYAIEALITAVPESEFSEVKNLQLAHEIWIRLGAHFEGDQYVNKSKLQNWKGMFGSAKMQEDKTIRSYFHRIAEIIAGIKSCAETITKDEKVWKILKSLPPTYENNVIVVDEIIVVTPNFDKETLFGKLQALKQRLKQNQNQTRTEIAFSTSIQANKRALTKSASTSGDYARDWATKNEEQRKIDEVLALLVKRQPKGKKVFTCWTCKVFSHFSYQRLKRERKVKPRKPYKSKITKDCFFVDENNEFNFKAINFLESDNEDDEIGFVVIKEESHKNKEKALETHVEKKKLDWTIYSGCSYHITSDMNLLNLTLMMEQLELETMHHVLLRENDLLNLM